MVRTATLFVYGSLLAGAGHPMHAVLSAAATPLGPACLRARLYDLGAYPGLVLDDTAGEVLGELYRLQDERAWVALDAYEGCGPDDPVPWEFESAACRVRTQTGLTDATVYIYTGPLTHAHPIPHGDYLAHLRP